MKLLRLKITDPNGFRSLPCGFEHHFRTEWTLQEELAQSEGFAPLVCAGPNGSGKSNLLEVLAAIFYQLEILRVRRNFLPEALQDSDFDFSPTAFELDYLIRVPADYVIANGPKWAKVNVWKKHGEPVKLFWENFPDFDGDVYENFRAGYMDILLPQYVLGYSSGENEILSLPFFKMQFVQFDEYLNYLKTRGQYPGYPDARLAYLDSSFSQAVLICNLMFQNDEVLQPFRDDVGVEALKEFRIIVRQSIEIDAAQFDSYAMEGETSVSDILEGNPALSVLEDEEEGVRRYRLNLVYGLSKSERSSEKVDPILERLKRCATLSYHDETTDSLILDYWVNDATKQAFRENFDNSPLALFQAFQVLLALNLHAVSETLKADLYRSTSHYVSETVSTLASDQRIMRFKFVRFRKHGVQQPMMLKELSDGEHQLLHSLGMCLLFCDTNCLFLLDEPETHFNPDWRANFISRLRECFPGNVERSQEMLITTHSPFLISDSKQEKVLVFEKGKDTGEVKINPAGYNTFGASINLITMKTFGKNETIGRHANQKIQELLSDPEVHIDPHALAKRIMDRVGDSIERTFAVQSVLSRGQSDKPKE